MASILKPNVSVGVAIATMALVYTIYSKNLPDMSTIHATDSHDPAIEAGRKKAAWSGVGAVSAITLLTRDVNPLVLGGLTVGVLDWHTRHANASDKVTGDLVSSADGYRQSARAAY